MTSLAEQAIPTLVVNPALKQNLHKSWEVGALLVVHGTWGAPHHAIKAICNVGSHHDLGGVVMDLLIPHTCGGPSTSANLHKSLEVGASASGAWDLGGPPW